MVRKSAGASGNDGHLRAIIFARNARARAGKILVVNNMSKRAHKDARRRRTCFNFDDRETPKDSLTPCYARTFIDIYARFWRHVSSAQRSFYRIQRSRA